MLKGRSSKFFAAVQNDGKTLKCILNKCELSTFCRFQDIAIQSYQFSSYFSAAIMPAL